MRMTLRQLAVFVAVAQEGTVTKASDAVKLTQSAASMALADLEDGLVFFIYFLALVHKCTLIY